MVIHNDAYGAQMAQYKLFDFLNDLNHEKKHILHNDYLAEKDYSPFIVNLAMSLRIDTILYANDMNIRHSIPKEMHYDYFYHALSAQKRFAKWPKKTKDEDVLLIKKYYNINTHRAMEYLSLISDDELQIIKRKMSIGGADERGTKMAPK